MPHRHQLRGLHGRIRTVAICVSGHDKCDADLFLCLTATAFHVDRSFRRQWFPTVSKVVVCTAIAISQAQRLWQSRKDKADPKSRDEVSAWVTMTSSLFCVVRHQASNLHE